jgi:outer membrane murein-binding lipoprotein Lpp
MAKVKVSDSSQPTRKLRPALSPEARENQLISLAVDLAEKQLQEGTASSQVITHYLKLGTRKEQLENEIKEMEKDMIKAKTEALKSQKRVEELYSEALKAMRNYSGQGDPDEYD